MCSLRASTRTCLIIDCCSAPAAKTAGQRWCKSADPRTLLDLGLVAAQGGKKKSLGFKFRKVNGPSFEAEAYYICASDSDEIWCMYVSAILL